MTGHVKGRRRSLRRAVALRCSLRSEYWEGELTQRASNVSTDGLWVETRLPLETGDELIVSFRPPFAREHEVVWASAQVVRAGFGRVPGERDLRPGVALALTYCSEEHRRLLARQLVGWPPELPPARRRLAPPPLPRSAP